MIEFFWHCIKYSQVQQSSLHEQKANGRKRFGSPSELVVEGTTSKRRHYLVDKENSQPDEQTPPCDKRAPDAELCSSFSTEAINSTTAVSICWICVIVNSCFDLFVCINYEKLSTTILVIGRL